MAPSVNLSDDGAELSRGVGQLFRLAKVASAPSYLAGAAAAAGLSVGQAMQFMDGSLLLPPRQSVAFANACLEQQRASRVSYAAQLRQPHGGSDIMGGGPAETTLDGVAGLVDELTQAFPGWRFELPDGHESIGG